MLRILSSCCALNFGGNAINEIMSKVSILYFSRLVVQIDFISEDTIETA